MTHSPHLVCDDGAARNSTLELAERGSVTKHLRTGSIALKTDHRQAEEGICGLVGAKAEEVRPQRGCGRCQVKRPFFWGFSGGADDEAALRS